MAVLLTSIPHPFHLPHNPFKGGLCFKRTLFNTVSSAAPQIYVHCVGGCRDRTQDNCDFGIGCQMLYLLGKISSIIDTAINTLTA